MDNAQKDFHKVVSTRCKDDLHVIFWDFDFGLQEPILHELSIIQSTYKLSNVYILKTARGFHGICLTKFHWSDMMKIVANTRIVDRLFILGIVRNFRGGLRYEGGLKPKYVCTLEAPIRNPRRKGSSAHKNFLKSTFSIDVEDDLDWDGYRKIDVIHTSKYIGAFKRLVNV